MPQLRDKRRRKSDALGGWDRARQVDLFPLYSRGDRRCARGPCITILNQYNPGPECLLHRQQTEGRDASQAVP